MVGRHSDKRIVYSMTYESPVRRHNDSFFVCDSHHETHNSSPFISAVFTSKLAFRFSSQKAPYSCIYNLLSEANTFYVRAAACRTMRNVFLASFLLSKYLTNFCVFFVGFF